MKLIVLLLFFAACNSKPKFNSEAHDKKEKELRKEINRLADSSKLYSLKKNDSIPSEEKYMMHLKWSGFEREKIILIDELKKLKLARASDSILQNQ